MKLSINRLSIDRAAGHRPARIAALLLPPIAVLSPDLKGTKTAALPSRDGTRPTDD